MLLYSNCPQLYKYECSPTIIMPGQSVKNNFYKPPMASMCSSLTGLKLISKGISVIEGSGTDLS